MDSVTPDALDLRLLHALQIDGRASFSKLSAVLGASDRTLARRLARLRTDGTVRIAGVGESRVLGRAEWLVRLRASPAVVPGLAEQLARRPDTAWVTVVSSATELLVVFRVPEEGPAPLAELARLPGVGAMEAQQLLRPLMERRWSGRTSALTAEEVAALRRPEPEPAAPVRLTALDRALLAQLERDGRASHSELARRVGWSESAVRRRLEELRASGALRVDVEVEPALLGYAVQCVLWLTVTPAYLGSLARTLAATPEAAYVATLTGARNLLAVVVCRDSAALDRCLEELGRLEGLQQWETALVTSYRKRVGAAPTPRRAGRPGPDRATPGRGD